ncbi:MAG: RNA polymerase factor sigma-54 [Deltaproteobacteria bacterium]|nr:RNA polymerase factor sigma-54 [Deltaproteobacteria bacterium]
MEIKQQLKLSQQLVMTPQLQMAIKLLQLSRLELIEQIRQEMLENPVLEDGQEIGPTAAKEAPDPASGAVTLPDMPEPPPTTAEPTTKEAEKGREDIDWDRYLENHAMQAPVPTFRGGDSEDLPSVEATLTRREGLPDHLFWQLRMADFAEDEMRFATLVIGNLDPDGYLKLDDTRPEDVVPQLAAEAGLDAEDAEEVLKIIQAMDPVGVATRDLRECLLVQARHLGLDQLVLDIIDKHMSNLEKKNYGAIARDLKVELDEVYDVVQIIGELEPRPGRNHTSEEPHYITPDVHVLKIGDQYYVVANDDGMPKLKISGFYRSAMQGDPKAREYIQSKLRSAQWLIRSIDQRRKTIVKVTECIVEKQKDFFEKGVAYLKPMILRDVAETVGMHESTISRVTTNKYVNTPQGLFELKYFFNSAISRAGEDDIASEAVKQAIKKIIAAENVKDPYSDQKIVEILREQNVIIARRTVAKYREMLGILSSSKRKQYF